jgi:ribonucleoside-diphosphate reductase alpha chain
MSIFNQTTDVIIQGGRRRGANMGILRCDHPDVFEFVESKLRGDALANFNISVAVTDRFMQAVRKNRRFDLLSPHTGKRIRSVKARALFDCICFAAWRTGDPGLIFLDEINRRNVIPRLGPIEATNPCSEVLLLPYESCNLASINLATLVRNGSIDWQRLRTIVHLGIRFLDDVIDVNRYPLRAIKQVTCANRKIGLGVMGFADLLIKLGIAYTERRAELLAARIMKFIQAESRAASQMLAATRGPFANIGKSIYETRKATMRNATVNAIAPTGTISIIAGCSSGIEPLFSISYMRTVMGGARLFELHPVFEQVLQSRGLFSQERLAQVRLAGSIKSLRTIPPDVRRLFVTSFDVAPQQHLRIQAAFQRHTDNSVSKTVNLPPDATVDDVRAIYMQAHALKCKGITVYRYGSRADQVLSFGPLPDSEHGGDHTGVAPPDCPAGRCEL